MLKPNVNQELPNLAKSEIASKVRSLMDNISELEEIISNINIDNDNQSKMIDLTNNCNEMLLDIIQLLGRDNKESA